MVLFAVAFHLHARFIQKRFGLIRQPGNPFKANLCIGMLCSQLPDCFQGTGDRLSLHIIAQQVERAGMEVQAALSCRHNADATACLCQCDTSSESAESAAYYYNVIFHCRLF